MTSLFNLAAEYKSVSDKLHDSDLDEQTIADTLEGMAGELEVKATNVGFVIRNLDSMAEQIKQAEESMAKRRKAMENRAKWLKSYLLQNMLATGKTKIESPYFVISVRNNPESVVIDAESQIPDDYFREIPATFEPNKQAIKQAIQDGFTVPGVHLARTQSLQIK